MLNKDEFSNTGMLLRAGMLACWARALCAAFLEKVAPARDVEQDQNRHNMWNRHKMWNRHNMWSTDKISKTGTLLGTGMFACWVHARRAGIMKKKLQRKMWNSTRCGTGTTCGTGTRCGRKIRAAILVRSNKQECRYAGRVLAALAL